MSTVKHAKKILSLLLPLSLLFCGALVFTGCIVLDEAEAVELPAGLGFEIKFLLDPEEVLYDDGSLRQSIRDLFNEILPWEGGAPGQNANNLNRVAAMQFMDTPAQDLNAAGWFNRIRYRSTDEGELELTYRRRISFWPVNEQTITDALRTAYLMGYGDFGDMEIDWSYNTAVLTISNIEIVTSWPESLEMPDEAAARSLMLENLPAEMLDMLEDIDAATYAGYLENSVIHGPVEIRRYRVRGFVSEEDAYEILGINRQIRVDFDTEIMPIADIFIVEVSISGSTGTRAQDFLDFNEIQILRNFLYEALVSEGILIPQSGLRTSVILAEYAR